MLLKDFTTNKSNECTPLFNIVSASNKTQVQPKLFVIVMQIGVGINPIASNTMNVKVTPPSVCYAFTTNKLH